MKKKTQQHKHLGFIGFILMLHFFIAALVVASLGLFEIAVILSLISFVGIVLWTRFPTKDNDVPSVDAY